MFFSTKIFEICYSFQIVKETIVSLRKIKTSKDILFRRIYIFSFSMEVHENTDAKFGELNKYEIVSFLRITKFLFRNLEFYKNQSMST